MESRSVPVIYRIDDGKPVHQYWTLSDDNTALFYPGNPTPFLQKLQRAKKFHLEYPPADKIPEVISLDVYGLPSIFWGAPQDQSGNGEHPTGMSALRKG
jgi:hypothetical protein